jgi:DNA-binding NarL/FixJ family response regulator
MRNSGRIDIALVEPSDIIAEGLSSVLLRSGIHYSLSRCADIDELTGLLNSASVHIAFINPLVFQNRMNEFMKINSAYPRVKWIGLIYSYFPNDQLNRFDDIFAINDPSSSIIEKLSKVIENHSNTNTHQENLSERETDVLIHLLKGMSNKEIADTLNISIHTVISHRKNIIEKTGIKSLPGLTIYAISRKIIGIDKE